MSDRVDTSRAKALFVVLLLAGVGAAWMAAGLELQWDDSREFSVPSIVRQRSPMDHTLGVNVPDPILGWTPAPGRIGRHRTEEYDVRYTIEPSGFRWTPGGDVAPVVACVGGSFTFGHGVEDAEAWPALLGSAWGVKVANAAAQGWGTAHALLRVSGFFEATDVPALVLYGWMGDHLVRNSPNREWLARQERMGVRAPVLRRGPDGWRFSHLNGEGGGDEATGDEQRLALELVEQMHAIVTDRGARFVMVALPTPAKYAAGDGAAVLDELRARGVAVVDATDASGGFYELDPHPTPAMHRAIAQRIRDEVDPPAH